MCNELVNFAGSNSIKYIIPNVEIDYDIERDPERCISDSYVAVVRLDNQKLSVEKNVSVLFATPQFPSLQ